MVDALNVIKLYPSIETAFTNNGLGYLPDATRCEVIEERNGAFELEMEYPVDGLRFNDIQLRSIIFAKPNIYDDPQPFRVYSISKPIGGVVTINAEHISYDMSGYLVRRFSVSEGEGLGAAIATITSSIILPSGTTCPFITKGTITSDFQSTGAMEVEAPTSLRSLLGDSNNSLLSIYGGELEFNRFNTILRANRGSNRGVSIRYGKNLTDIRQEENCSNVYTAVYPYYHYKHENSEQIIDTIYTLEWHEGDEKKYYNGDGLVPVEGTFDFIRILPLDVSSEWNNLYKWTKEFPSKDEILAIAEKYIIDNNIGVPSVNITVSFELLSQTEEYKNVKLLEDIRLCDTVTVEFPKLGISAQSKCIKTTYNVITGKYISIELGDSKSNLAASIAANNIETEKEVQSNYDYLTERLNHAVQLITGNLGGYVVLHDADLNGIPDEILIMDTPDKNSARKVWRWNQAGLAYSKHGYEPDISKGENYDVAITQEGEIDARFITVGEMTANRVRGGTFEVGGNRSAQDGIIDIRDVNNNLLIRINKDGIRFYDSKGNIAADGKYITDIANDTITTSFIKALNLKVGDEIQMGENATISWGKVTGTDDVANKGDIPSDSHITQITRDTVTTETLNCVNLTAGHVAAENITGTTISGKTILGGNITGASIAASDTFQMDTYYNAYDHGYEAVIQSGWSDYSVVFSVPILKIGNSRPLYFTQWPVVYGSSLSILGASGIDSMIWTESQSKGKYIHVNTSIDGAYGISVWASDTRLKKNIKDTEQTSLDKIKQIRFIQFDWKSNDAHVDLGISANELEKIVPEAIIDVEQNPDDKYESLKNIDTSMMVVYALKAIQEQQSEIEELKKQVNKLMSLIEERM